MAASFILDTATRTDLADVINAAQDTAGAISGGLLNIYTAAYASLLVSIPIANPAGSVSSGVLTLTVTAMNANAGASGTAAVFRLYMHNGSTLVASGDVGTSGASVNLQNTSINSGQNVSITSATITVPAGT